MALKTKAISVTGNVEWKNGVANSNLAPKVETAVETALSGLNHDDVVDIKIGVGGDSALILVIYKSVSEKEKPKK